MIMSRKTATFAIVWLGQFVSVVGSGLTSFALGVWVFQRTGSPTQFALIGLSAVLPRVLISPLAGVVVDRWDRRKIMILSDLGAGLGTAALVLLLMNDRLEIWTIYLITCFSSAFGAFQWPAYAAATTLLIPKENLGRANGLVHFGRAAAEILSPLMAGVLLQSIHLYGVILVDFATFFFAVGALLFVRFPSPQRPHGHGPAGSSWSRDLTFGLKYLLARKGLLGLLAFFVPVNLIWGMVGALITPMILGFTTSDALGAILSIAGLGMLSGSVIMTIWGGPRRRVAGVLGFEFMSGVCFILIGLRPEFWTTALGAFGAHLTIAMVYGSNQALWQTKVEPAVQGRVFAAQQMVERIASPLAYLLAGPLAEKVFEPMLAPSGELAATLGMVVGIGAGRGIGLLFMVMGVVKLAVVLAGYANPRVRQVEDELPDMVSQ